MRSPLRIKLLAFKGAERPLFVCAEEKLEKIAEGVALSYVDDSPDVLYFLSGGSERAAVESVGNSSYVLLLAGEEANAWASATEVKSWLDMRGIENDLVKFEESKKVLVDLAAAVDAKTKLEGQKIGLVGQVSDWLVNSSIEPAVIRDRLKINFSQILWDDIAPYTEFPVSEQFLDHFKEGGHSGKDLEDASKVYSLLEDTIRKEGFDAVTVECFSLVKKHGVTGCLALSLLGDRGIPAACEGDMTAVVGMMVGRELSGTIPWMANTTAIDGERIFFSHCTTPLSIMNRFSITTHFETGIGTAIKGDFKGDCVTVLRFDSTLSRYFAAEGRITARPDEKNACRTQIIVELGREDAQRLKNSPLGNHHLIIPGNFKNRIDLFCLLTEIEATDFA